MLVLGSDVVGDFSSRDVVEELVDRLKSYSQLVVAWSRPFVGSGGRRASLTIMVYFFAVW